MASIPKRVDAFIFYNELAMLEYRLTILDDIVDHFILVEARQTFTGTPKDLIYQSNISRFGQFIGKVTHIIVDLPYSDAWANEHLQRSSIGLGIEQLGLDNSDRVIVSDVDEIPDINALLFIKSNPGIADIVALRQDLYYYNIETKYTDKWCLAKVATVAAVSAMV